MHRNSGKALLIVAAFVLFLVPVAAIAAGQTFTDVPPDDWGFHDVEWLAANGLTNGCGDGTTFCPDDPVSRREMAAFTHRLAIEGVVDAATAMDADKLDGKDSTAFASSSHDHDADYLAIGGKADDADLLDGNDSTAFVLQSDLAMPLALFDGVEDHVSWIIDKGTYTTLRTVSLTPPADGTVVANSSVTVLESTASDAVACNITNGGTWEAGASQDWQSPGTPGGMTSLSGTRGFEVTGGQTLTIEFKCNPVSNNTSPDTDFWRVWLTAIYIPNP